MFTFQRIAIIPAFLCILANKASCHLSGLAYEEDDRFLPYISTELPSDIQPTLYEQHTTLYEHLLKLKNLQEKQPENLFINLAINAAIMRTNIICNKIFPKTKKAVNGLVISNFELYRFLYKCQRNIPEKTRNHSFGDIIKGMYELTQIYTKAYDDAILLKIALINESLARENIKS